MEVFYIMTKRNEKGQFIKGENVRDLKGQKFGRLTVLSIDLEKSNKGRKTYWNCVCECGNEKSIRSDSLTSKTRIKTESCGCLHSEKARENISKNHSHKSSNTRLYHTWQGMKDRCYNKNSNSYNRYGNKGIVVCDEWINDFSNFKEWALKNGYDDNLTIERLDFNGNYESSNCTWITRPEQSNNRSSSIFVEYKGEKLNLKQWSDKLGIKYGTLNSRYKRGNTDPEVLFSPVYDKSKKTPS